MFSLPPAHGEVVMARRGYLDFTPQELRARRIAFFGLALFLMPPLLSLCHLEQFVCRAGWRIDVASLITLWSLFPWMVLVAVIMLCGLAILTIGGVLLLLESAKARNRVKWGTGDAAGAMEI
jgi:hypothetical protein